MTTNWTGKFFAVKRADGKYDVGITMPTGVIEGSQIAVFDGSGPFPPTGFPQRKVVDDLNEWLAQLQTQGYTLKPSSM